MNRILATAIAAITISGCASAPAPEEYQPQPWLDRVEVPAYQTQTGQERLCEALGSVGRKLAEARQLGVPRSKVEQVVPTASSAEMRQMLSGLIALAYDAPAGVTRNPSAFGDVVEVVCLEEM